MAKMVVIKSSAHDGYRRAGLSLVRGRNEFPLADLSKDQIATLESDQRLAVQIEGEDDKPKAADKAAEKAAKEAAAAEKAAKEAAEKEALEAGSKGGK